MRSKPDGYTLFINPGNGLASFPYLYKNLTHNVLTDLAPVTTLVKLPFCLAVAPNSPAKNMAEFLALIKQKGDKASYGYPNNLSLAAGELLNERMGLKAVGVAYKSTPEAMNDMTNGLIDYLFSDATFGLAQAKGGKMRMLAFTSAARSELDPNLPTMQESGVPNYNVTAWWGAWYPAKTPKPIIDQTSKWLNEILADPETKNSWQKLHLPTRSPVLRNPHSNISSRIFRAGPNSTRWRRCSRNKLRVVAAAHRYCEEGPTPWKACPAHARESGHPVFLFWVPAFAGTSGLRINVL